MTPHYTDEWLSIYEGDCRDVLRELPADSVDCVVTSPPYWGLRDYGTATWVGGDDSCDHRPNVTERAQRPANGLTGGKTHVDAGTVRRGNCGKCGAQRVDRQLGLERTPEEYVANMVAVFREVRRVLKPSGTCWLNLGDSYAGSGKGGNPEGSAWSGFVGSAGRERAAKASAPYLGLAQKQLVGIPWHVAFALQADGWYLRSDIIWSKPNPMPESVTDRPTKSHEYLFLLTKSARYYFDSEAVRESVADATIDRLAQNVAEQNGSERVPGKVNGPMRAVGTSSGRNIRSVWTIATQPYKGAHFAVFPPELPERCIKAGSSEKGICPECGAPWERVVERTPVPRDLTAHRGTSQWAEGAKTRNDTDLTRSGQEAAKWKGANPDRVLGWRPTCAHDAVPIPSVTLDPFGGSGTVGMVANRLSRRAILIDLNPEYLRQQMQRNAQTPLGLDAA